MPSGINCLFETLSASDQRYMKLALERQVVPMAMGQPVAEDDKLGADEKGLDDRLNVALKTCRDRNHWDTRRAEIAESYIALSIADDVYGDVLAKRGVPPEKVDAIWAAVTPEDLVAFDMEHATETVVQNLSRYARAVGVEPDKTSFSILAIKLLYKAKRAKLNQLW